MGEIQEGHVFSMAAPFAAKRGIKE